MMQHRPSLPASAAQNPSSGLVVPVLATSTPALSNMLARAPINQLFGLAAIAILVLGLLFGTHQAQAGSSNVKIESLEIKRSQSPAEAYKVLFDMLNDKAKASQLDALLKHLNASDPAKTTLPTDKDPWRMGQLVPPWFSFTQNSNTLAKVIRFGPNGAFSLYNKIRVVENGIDRGIRPVKWYVYDVLPTRNAGKPYTAGIAIGVDMQTGVILFVRSLVREFEDNNPLVLHEFPVNERGQVWRLSNKKGQTMVLAVYSIAAGINKSSAEIMDKRTLPNAQRATTMFEQAKQLVITDSNADQNSAIAATTELTSSENEVSWKQIRTELLNVLKDALKKLGKSLLEAAKEYLKQYGDALAGYLKDLVGGFLGGLLGLFGL